MYKFDNLAKTSQTKVQVLYMWREAISPEKENGWLKDDIVTA